MATPKRPRSSLPPKTPVDESKNKDLDGSITAIRRLIANFEADVVRITELQSGDFCVSEAIKQDIDRAASGVRIATLLRELSTLITHNPVTGDLRDEFEQLERKVLGRICLGDTEKILPFPKVPSEFYVKRHDKTETAIDFTKRVYGPWLGTFSFNQLRKLDMGLYNALCIWKSKGNPIPEDFHLPTKKQANDQALEKHGLKSSELTAEAREMERLASALRRRKRAAQKTL